MVTSFQEVTLRVLIACHNRRALTESIIEQLNKISANSDVSIEVFAVDDGSNDGTRELLQANRLVRKVFVGDGSLFWAKSMAIAEKMALDEPVGVGKECYLLWLNDDVELFEDKFVEIFHRCIEEKTSIFIGPMMSDEGVLSYGGFARKGKHPLSFRKVSIDRDGSSKVDTFNGNFVMYSKTVGELVGPIDGSFSHSLADIDYGLRAVRKGVDIKLHRDYLGRCNLNQVKTFDSRLEAWGAFLAPKGGGNFKSLKRILRKNSRFWLLWILVTYGLWWTRRATPAKGYTS